MSEINKKLNALSQQNNINQAGSAPLRAAKVKPLPKNNGPLWLAAGLCVAVIAGGAGWWLGTQSQEMLPAVVATDKPEKQTEAQPLIELPEPEQLVVENVPEILSTKGTNVALEGMPVQREQKVKLKAEHEVITAVAKSNPTPKVVVKPAEMKKAEVKKAVAKPVATAEKQAPKAAVTVKAPQLAAVEAEPQEQTEGLMIETVELDAEQLANVEYQKAKKALKSGDSRKAIGYLESALKYQPEWVKARQKLSALYYGRGDTRKAIAALQQGLALDGEQPDLRLTMAKLLVNESQQQAALNVLSRLPTQHHRGYLAMRGALAQQLKNNELAMSSYELLVKDEPYDGRWWMGLGIALERSEAVEKASDAYKQALLMGRISQQSQQFIQQRLAVLEAREG
ncbi:tetratricopeptide repeat protein [Photobacterium sp. SDRW27]|uniref:tetratricopeptide repeat protein n=1 Tax=Photobacterium obscurum TaxID=2829490 RepID=UPI0022449A0D|nr:tetratricopeptide repeat protein [Photobacterium obscurum]MCW8330420.1 tetratricopeptide repeat protein [Photobacterium obscurum]